MTCGECEARLSVEHRELPLTGPETTGPVHGVERCFAYCRLRQVFEVRFPSPWQVLIEPRPGALLVTVSRRVGGAGRVSAARLVPESLVVAVSDARAVYGAEVTAQRMAVELAEKGHGVAA